MTRRTDPLAPARGIRNGLAVVLPFWLAVAAALVWLVTA